MNATLDPLPKPDSKTEPDVYETQISAALAKTRARVDRDSEFRLHIQQIELSYDREHWSMALMLAQGLVQFLALKMRESQADEAGIVRR